MATMEIRLRMTTRKNRKYNQKQIAGRYDPFIETILEEYEKNIIDQGKKNKEKTETTKWDKDPYVRFFKKDYEVICKS